MRWDWTDDGVWDTDWSRDKATVHRYLPRGRHRIRLVVRDSADDTTQVIHSVIITSVEIRSAVRSAGYVEEVRICPDPHDPSSCFSHALPHQQKTFAQGPVEMHTDWSGQFSTVGGDTLAFDGTIRGGIAWPFHSNWSDYDVTFYSCDSICYRWQGQTNCCGGVSLTGSAVLLEARSDFRFEGVLPAGSYRLRAGVLNLGEPYEGRLTFEMILQPLREPGDLSSRAH